MWCVCVCGGGAGCEGWGRVWCVRGGDELADLFTPLIWGVG